MTSVNGRNSYSYEDCHSSETGAWVGFSAHEPANLVLMQHIPDFTSTKSAADHSLKGQQKHMPAFLQNPPCDSNEEGSKWQYSSSVFHSDRHTVCEISVYEVYVFNKSISNTMI